MEVAGIEPDGRHWAPLSDLAGAAASATADLASVAGTLQVGADGTMVVTFHTWSGSAPKACRDDVVRGLAH